nr:MAG TPA: hypothetical protein [Caudoviricetes sp.]
MNLSLSHFQTIVVLQFNTSLTFSFKSSESLNPVVNQRTTRSSLLIRLIKYFSEVLIVSIIFPISLTSKKSWCCDLTLGTLIFLKFIQIS